jgi:hypothetical protein
VLGQKNLITTACTGSVMSLERIHKATQNLIAAKLFLHTNKKNLTVKSEALLIKEVPDVAETHCLSLQPSS